MTRTASSLIIILAVVLGVLGSRAISAQDKYTVEASTPPQGHDAKCGFACHTVVKNRDYVFTEYGHR